MFFDIFSRYKKQHRAVMGYVFLIPRKNYPGPSLIQFRLKGNDISKSVSKMVVRCRSSPIITINMYKK